MLIVPFFVFVLIFTVIIFFLGLSVFKLILNGFGIWTPIVIGALLCWFFGMDNMERFTNTYFNAHQPTTTVSVPQVNRGVVTTVSHETIQPFDKLHADAMRQFPTPPCTVPRTVEYVGDDGKMHSDYCATHH